jgi:acetyl-CoA carboxylase biotin carboxyl carrier protein
MDIKFIRDLTKLMRDNDLIELVVESEDSKVKMAKAQPSAPAMITQAAAAPQMAAAPAPASAPAAAPVDEFANCKQITAPIPGTVYLKPNPDSELYVTPGSKVGDGDTVCLLEAMKVFNEIKCEGLSGTIKKVCVEDGQPVEYGTVLFLVG